MTRNLEYYCHATLTGNFTNVKEVEVLRDFFSLRIYLENHATSKKVNTYDQQSHQCMQCIMMSSYKATAQ